MTRPLVSILIPFRNTEKFLGECMDSILAQSYPKWEVLAIDDRSTDASGAIVGAYASRDQRIRVFKNMGQGIIPALRTAYMNSIGGLVTRMDSDDIMVPDKLEVMVNLLQANGKGHLAVGQVKYFSEIGISNGYARYEYWLNGLTVKGDNYSEIYKECVIPSPCWMVHKEDLDKCGAFGPDLYPEDYDLTFRFYEKGIKCIPCDQLLHYWRDYATRTSRTSEHYAQNYFLDIKLHYFLKLDYDPSRPLTVWGAGFKGKKIAKGLKEKGIPFYWLCDNPKKIGKEIYGEKLVHFNLLEQLKAPQSIVTVASEEAQVMIHGYFYELGHCPMKDYYFFC